MSMIASYMSIDKNLMNKLRSNSSEDLIDEIESLEEIENLEENRNLYSLNIFGDALHFLLTNVSATTPIEDDLLSEAIIGTYPYEEFAEFISFIYPERVPLISDALNNFDINSCLEAFSPEILDKNEIYPNIWAREDKEILKKELLNSFNGLKKFYETVTKNSSGIVVSIY